MVVILLALLAAAQDPAAAPAPADATAAAAPDKMICKKVSATGSRIRKGEVCLPASEWAQRTKDDQKALKDMQDRQVCARNAC